MQRGKSGPWLTFSRGVVAGWLVLWLLFSSLLAASPSLHERFHESAAQASHHCAVTLVEQQQVLFGEAHVFVFHYSVAESELILPTTPVFLSQADWKLLPGRAPPALS